jgi:hypothetical protein
MNRQVNKTIARQNEQGFGSKSIDIEKIAIEKDQDYENERTWWIFEDGSALGLDSDNIIYVNDNYGLHRDHEKL